MSTEFQSQHARRERAVETSYQAAKNTTNKTAHTTTSESANTREDARKERVNRLIALARAYRGWSVGELSDALGREPRRVLATNGNPRLDLLARLARALDWDLGDIAAGVWSANASSIDSGRANEATFAELDRRAQEEHRNGDFRAMERTAHVMRLAARDGHERATALNRLAGVHDGLGRYALVLDAVREGLAETGVGPDLRLMLTVNLANASYTLWNIDEARSIASSLLADLGDDTHVGHPSRLRRVAHAFSHAVCGHSERRLLARACRERDVQQLAASSAQHLESARSRFAQLAEDFGDAQYAGLAEIARGGLLEVGVLSGTIAADEGIAAIVNRLDTVVDLAIVPSYHQLEALGWWSIFGANIALRAGDEQASLRAISEEGTHDRALAICTNKAAEIAEAVDSWPMRERAFTLEWCRRCEGVAQLARETRDSFAAWTLDLEDLRILVGTMARFPLFRRVGWQIIDHAQFAVT
ncbi:MAG: hypothetical protein QM516_01805 [Limnohabitans sp.]|nr:hypothetical protein [Limnohabitans sp.]